MFGVYAGEGAGREGRPPSHRQEEGSVHFARASATQEGWSVCSTMVSCCSWCVGKGGAEVVRADHHPIGRRRDQCIFRGLLLPRRGDQFVLQWFLAAHDAWAKEGRDREGRLPPHRSVGNRGREGQHPPWAKLGKTGEQRSWGPVPPYGGTLGNAG